MTHSSPLRATSFGGYATLNLPDTLNLLEGTSRSVSLDLVNIRQTSMSWSYYIEYGSAGTSDLANTSGSGSMSIAASPAINENATRFSLSALTDGIQEQTETAWLVVNLSGITFADGLSQARIAINILDNNLTTGTDRNDVLRGTSGVDTLRGGLGNDSYYVTAGDRVIEAADGGIDTVYSGIDWTLHQNVENLVLTGTGNIAGTGNALNNYLTGNAGDNILNGRAGADTMAGGAGNDIYIVDNIGDRVIERAGGGIDTVRASVSHTLGVQVENLNLTGSANLSGTGNLLANRITGNAGNNVLRGEAGADILIGGAGDDRLVGGLGADRLTGGVGADIFVFEKLQDSRAAAAGRDVITDFSRAQGDRIDLSGIDANIHRAGDQAFTFIGNAGFSETAGELRTVRQNGVLFVNGDVNGDGVADFSVQVNLPVGLIAADFIL